MTVRELPFIDRAGVLRSQLPKLEAFLDDPRSLLVPVWRDNPLLLRHGEGSAARVTLEILELGGARALLDERFELVFLGVLEDRGVFAVDVSSHGDPMSLPALRGIAEFLDLRMAGMLMPEGDAALAGYARGLLSWHRRNGFCPACGSASVPRRGGHVRVCKNEGCNTEHFPRTDPAVIMLVQDGDRCLIGRQRGWPAGLYSTLAGFVEPGETLEMAVEREIEEESGVRVTDVKYFASQPWPFPQSLMLGFTATATTRELRMDTEELEDLRWVTRDELRKPEGFWVPTSYSLASKLLRHFLAE
jgi:NAD+ diphosphatase